MTLRADVIGLRDKYLPDKEDLLLTLTASYHSRVAEIYDDLLGAGPRADCGGLLC